jgi:acetoin:2,6-dichlorophenolindophenol oxidoreductase subunit alpha
MVVQRGTKPDKISCEEVVELFEKMAAIRHFEDRVHEAFQKGLIYGSTHLAQGQEAVSVGAISALGDDDKLTYTYRGHNQVLARGMDPKAAFAEIFGREDGCSKGLGGSMHLADLKLGLLGSFAIVGAGLPVAVGAAISAQLQQNGTVAMTFFGDGATNIGTFHEAMNLASVWKLPCIFICENNLYGEYSPILTTTPYEDLVRRADAYGMPGHIVDGNDVLAVRGAAMEAVARARNGLGPTFLECKTYRQCGHSRSDPGKYRPPGELKAWKERDPLIACAKVLADSFGMNVEQINSLRESAKSRIDVALNAAEASPFPLVRDLMSATYEQVPT